MNNKRDVSVEVARVIGCLIVIGCHVYPSIVVEGRCILNRLFLACLMADGVAIFWLVMGFFLFNNTSYSKLIKKTVRNIAIPMIIFSIVVFFFSDWINGNLSLWKSVCHTKDEYVSLIKNLLLWRNPVAGCDHLWYLYVYFLIILIFPVLKAFTKYLDEDPTHEKWFLIISFCFLLLNDLTRNGMAQFSHVTINALVPASIEVVWGHILYRHKERIAGKKCILISMTGFVIFNLIRTAIQWNRYVKLPDRNELILYWYSSFGILCALCIAIFVFAMHKAWENEILTKIICCVSSCTFVIYMIQYLSMGILTRLGYQEIYYNLIYKSTYGWKADALYTFGYVLSVFGVSFIFVFGMKFIKKYIKGFVVIRG